MRALVIGDAMLDHYIEGTAERFCPDAPGAPIVRAFADSYAPGGAANVAACLVALHWDVTLAAVIGRDAAAKQLGEECARVGIRLAHEHDEDRPTTVKTRIRAEGHTLLRYDREWTRAVPAATIERLLDALTDRYDAIVVSDYSKGMVSSELIHSLLDIGSPLFIDPSPTGLQSLPDDLGPSHYLKLNRFEARPRAGRFAGPPIASPTAGVAHVQAMRDALSGTEVHLTLGPDGVAAAAPGATIAMPALALDRERDVQGAGDAYMAGLVDAASRDVGLKGRVAFASACAAAAVTRRGTYAPRRKEAEKWLP